MKPKISRAHSNLIGNGVKRRELKATSGVAGRARGFARAHLVK